MLVTCAFFSFLLATDTMQRRTGGGIPSEIAKSNRSAGGGVTGADIGDVLPGVLESLQESGAATITPRLYYDEILGQFNYPSYQKNYGVYNTVFQNIEQFGDTGETWVERDLFWCGPCTLNMQVPISYRYSGLKFLQAGVPDITRVRPQYFYSWGAGYAAAKLVEINMGGAMTYRIDRYANFMGIMASCFSIVQRMALMQMSGGGVLQTTPGLEHFMGLGSNSLEYTSQPNYNRGGAVSGTTVYGTTAYLPSYDNWIVCLKTPHTNFNHPRNPRKCIDTNILSEPFNIRLQTGSFHEFTDSGCGVTGAQGNGLTESDPFSISGYTGDVGLFRQYHCDPYAPFLDPTDNVTFFGNNTGSDASWALLNSIGAALTLSSPGNFELTFPTSVELANNGNPKPYPMTPSELPSLRVEHVISSMRLTNPTLGAYDVLKNRLDQAVYYPFQHFTTQTYFPSNPTYYSLTLEDVITNNFFEATVPLREKTFNRQLINIPVNPLTAMYIMVFREKDRNNEISKVGGYNPSLFWHGLNIPKYAISYGAEKLLSKDNNGQILCEQIYNACSPITIPYKGGACTRAEYLHQKNPLNTLLPAPTGCTSQGKFSGVTRQSYMIEVSLCEHRPLMTEETFQQTPSFLGEQLNFDFYYAPCLAQALGDPAGYNPNTDVSLLDFYPTTRQGATHLHLTHKEQYCDARISQESTASTGGIAGSDIKFGGVANSWVLNNGPLMIQVVYAQNALWQMNPNFSKVVFSRG